jgi:hemoglobin
MYARQLNARKADACDQSLGLKIITIVISIWLSACAAPPQMAEQSDSSSLYERLGGRQAIIVVVDNFGDSVAADERVNRYFADADLTSFKMLLAEQICVVSGGPCKYTGRSMRAAHAGMEISDQDFAAVVEDLQKTLNRLDVPAREQNDLLTLLGGMKSDIVR